MSHGELEQEAIAQGTRFMFGLDKSSMPSHVVITPYRVEEYFEGFQLAMKDRGLAPKKMESSGKWVNFLVHVGDNQALFCEGGIGASSFADSSYILCHCDTVKEIVFVGTGGGIGEEIQSGDLNLPASCIRLDKVLEVLLPPGAPANTDSDMRRRMRGLIEKEVQGLGIKIYEGIHATVPFFFSETRQLLTDLQKQGAISVDMELSVLCALASQYHKKAVGIVRIGDLPLKRLPTWKSRSYKVKLKKEVHMGILKAIIEYLSIHG